LGVLTGNWSELIVNRRAFLTNIACTAAASFNLGLVHPLLGEKVNMLDEDDFVKMRRYAKLRNCRVAYVQQGHGHAALFLHGFPLNGFQWRGVIPLLAAHRCCLAPDFMSLGYTETAESQEITPETQAEMLAEFLDVLKIEVVDVVSNDSGGEIAQIFVARYPTRVRTLLLSNCDVDTNSPPPSFAPLLAAAKKGVLADSFSRLLADKATARSQRGLGPFYANPENLADEAIDYYLTPLVSSSLRKKQLNDFAASFEKNPLVAIEPELRTCPAPTRILWGTADTTFDVKWADWLDKTLPHSRGVRRLNGAKLFFPEEMPEIVAEEAMRLWGV
jgi:haloalkane dehalogenase